MRLLLSDAAGVLAVVAVVIGVAVWARTRRLDPAVPVLLDLLLAAGLLRLAAAHDWPSIGFVALLAAVRQVAVLGLRAAPA